MRALCLASLAWVAVVGLCGSAVALTIDEARHLLARTGFGATAAEIDRLRPLDRVEAVDLLLGEAALPSEWPLPDWADANPMTIRRMDDRAVADALLAAQGETLRAWWVARMLASPTPLRERITLFWHGHFASALSKVRSPQLMLRQNRLIRRLAFGDFHTLLGAMLTDPAMLLYLDGGANAAAAPNENLAREAMELFALGVGRFGEDDVREAARALTGWAVHPATGDALFVASRHDPGDKSILGRVGPWTATDLVTILLDQPSAARFVAGGLWAEFIASTPDESVLTTIADGFRESGYRTAPLVRAILLHPAFWAAEERGAMIAGPIEWTVGALRLLGADGTPPGPVADLAADLGQALFEPPNVAGWPGGPIWISPATLAMRQDTIARFIAGPRGAVGAGLAERRSQALVRWLDDLPFAWRRPDRLRALVLPIAPAAAGGAALPAAASPDPEALADLVRGWLSDPVFQLK